MQRELSHMARQNNLDTVLHGRIMAMVGLLNLYLDDTLGYTWMRASEVAAKLEGRGTSHARTTRHWVLNFAHSRDLPTHKLGRTQLTLLDDEDIASELKLALSEKLKDGFLTASDVVDIVSSPEMQAQFARAGINKPSISASTARCWLSKLGWRYGRHQNGMYVDGHKCEDVVKYQQGFVERFKEYERRFHTWDDTGNELPHPATFPVPGAIGRFHLVLIMHNESTFYQNDQRQIRWGCPGSGAPKPKGEGTSLMVSDFLSADWGRLKDSDRCVLLAPFPSNLSHLHSDAQVIFRPGKNRDGWFTADDLIAQVDCTINIFNGLTDGHAQALFLFDNAPSHQKHADDVISARRMVKGAQFVFSHVFCSHSLQHQKRTGHINQVVHACMMVNYPLENLSHFIFPMTTPPWPAGSRAWKKAFVNMGCGQKQAQDCMLSARQSAPLAAQTAAADGSSSFNQISLVSAHSSRSLSSSMVTCATFIPSTIASSISLSSTGVQQRLNTASFPEPRQFKKWRALSRNALTMSPFFTFDGPFSFSFCSFFILFIMSHQSCHHSFRFANQAAHFVAAYRGGLSGAQAAWANKKYHGHQMLPPQGILEAKGAVAVGM